MSDLLNRWSALDIAALSEACDLECKAAQGRDGRGEVPEDFWKSYSAMANADGGVILLGIKEKPRGQFEALGLGDVERVRKALWDNLHNRKQISDNLLGEDDVQPIDVDGKTVLQVNVPRARRQQRPVHLGGNPFGNTYQRRYEGDYAVDDETVRRMMAERVEDSRDERILRHYGIDDLDMETVAAYRNRFASVRSSHVWAELPTPEFLERIGAWGRNRDENYGGLRIAGLLMFGRADVIRDVLPHYMVDYQERPQARTERRWVDRLVPDGSWSGNLYDFFRRVYQKLTADLKVPFQLQDGQRIDDSPVHEALREALANALIHADYSGRISVLVVKRPDMFGFRNPGQMRIPPAIAVQGGNSDCRNRRLQTMFQLVGYGDHAGSGLPKIYSNWTGQHWRRPMLYDMPEPEQTLMELRMSSLVPEQVVAELEEHFGAKFRALPELARLALITAHGEGQVNHARLREISTDHPADITKMLAGLVRDELLASAGTGRGMVYYLPWQKRSAVVLFDAGETGMAPSLPAHPVLTPEQPGLTPQLRGLTPQLDGLTPGLPSPLPPLLVDWEAIPGDVLAELTRLALPVSQGQRARKEVLQATVQALCQGRFLGPRVLGRLLGRESINLRKQTLKPMVAAGLLQQAFVASSDPRQAYIAIAETDEK